MHFNLFFMFVYVDRVITLKTGDPYVCPKKVKTSNTSETKTEIHIECCPNYIYQNRKCEACPPGKYGQDCSENCLPNNYGVQCKNICNCRGKTKCDPIHGCICFKGFTGRHCLDVCPTGRYGVNCSEECFCAHDAKCDPVTGFCLCPAGWFGDHCTKECPFEKFGHNCNGTCDCSDDEKCDVVTGECLCHGRYYDYNYNGVYNCSETCVCKAGAICSKQSGICECTNSSSCLNINGKGGFYFNPILIISVVCVPMLVLTSVVLLGHRKYRKRQSDQNNDQGHYHEINLYSEIRDDDLQDMIGLSIAITQDFPTDNIFQLTNREHENQNNAQSLPNIYMIEEQYFNPYCSLQYADDDYLNPYCALRFERRVKSCSL